MKYLYFLFVLLLLEGQLTAQLSTMDIRRADGKGPYPFYLTGHVAFAYNHHLFDEFTDDYRAKYEIENEKTFLRGFEVNGGVVINERNFLGIKGWLVRGMAIEMGYRYLDRNLTKEYELTDQVTTTRRLNYQTSTFSIRLCKRMPFPLISYPLTWQIQAGPTLYNFYIVKERETENSAIKSERDGFGAFQKAKNERRLVSGLDARVRFSLFDPAGTAGGVGYYFEYRYLWTSGNRDLSPLYDTFLGYQKHVIKHWDYGSVTVGMVVPLAVRMVSSE